MDAIYQDILEHVRTLEIIDTHEHLPGREEARLKETDVLQEYLTHYFNSDLRSAGLPDDDYLKVIDHTLPLMERWQLVEPYWEKARYTGYGRALDISARDLYGIEHISGDTIEALNQAFLDSLKPGHFHRVLKEKSCIRISLLDVGGGDYDPTLFLPIYRFDHFIFPQTRQDVEMVEREVGFRVCSFDDWLAGIEVVFDKLPQQGFVALKHGLAYERPLYYERVGKKEAEEGFNAIFKVKHFPEWVPPAFTVGKACQDYVMHFVLRHANRHGYTYQVHTGIQEGSGNLIANSDPALLSNLFVEYPDVDFDIFHIGYPYEHTLSALAKMFPNVCIDMCWAHIISPTASVNALIEWLDAVPANKISAFGGDYGFVDAVYGHQYLARMNVSKALVAKVQDGVFGVDKAKEIAQMLFVRNPLAIFKLEGRAMPLRDTARGEKA